MENGKEKRKSEKKMINITMANRLQEIIDALGITKKELAEGLGVADITIRKKFQGTASFSVELLKKLKDKYNVNLNYLFASEREKYHYPMFIRKDCGKSYFIGDKLKQFRKERKLTKKAMYSKLCLIQTEAEFMEIEENRKEACEGIIYEICYKFNVDFEYFIKD